MASDECLDTDVLTVFIDGQAGTAVGSRVESHASRCDACRELLSALARNATPGATGDEVASVAHMPVMHVGRYEITSALGVGGMGVVYAARDPELGRTVAIKLLHGDGGAVQERLRREARAMAKLAHPNVVAVHDVGQHGDSTFIAMEYVAGQTLAAWFGRPRTSREILEVYLAAGCGLAAAHAAGIVHRDFKPENVLIGDDGRVRVADFGVAHTDSEPTEAAGSPPLDAAAAYGNPLPGPGKLTETGTVLGTPHYIAPELYRGGSANTHSDQFSFCVALFRSLFGIWPFDGDSVEALSADITAARICEPGRVVGVPRRVRTAIRRGLAPQPGDRFATMNELLAVLAPPRRHRLWLGVLAATIAALAAFAAMRSEGPVPCAGAAAAIDDVWGPSRKLAVVSGVRAAGASYGEPASQEVARVLDRYASGWRAMRVDACRTVRIRREQSEDMLDLRMSCLDQRLRALDGLAGVLTSPDAATAARAVKAAHELPAIADCADLTALASPIRPPSAQVKLRVEQLRAERAKLDALRAVGTYEPTIGAARDLADRARALGYRPLEAETERLVAELQKLLGHPDLARAAYEQAKLAAEAGRDDRAAAAIAIELLDVIAMGLGETNKIEPLRNSARALLERIDRPPELEARLLEISGSVEIRAAHFAPAERDLTAALALREHLGGKMDLGLRRVLHELAYLEIQRAHAERARPYIERALAIDKATLGDQHPDTAEAEEFLGGIASETGQYAEAEQIFQRSLAIYTRDTGPDSIRVAGVLAPLARVYLMQGKPGEALALYRRANAIHLRDLGPRHELTLWTQIGIATGLQGIGQKADAHQLLLGVLADARTALGPEHQTLALALETITRVELDLAQYAAARLHMQEAFAMYRHVIGNDYGDSDTLRLLGEADLGSGHLATAVAYLEDARRKVTEEVPAGDADQGARWIDGLLGRALYESGRDRTRGLQLVTAAWSAIAHAPGDEAQARRIQLAAWMKAHGIPTPR